MGTENGSDKMVTFMQQMIPHHENAVQMTKLLLKHTPQDELDAVEGLGDILHGIINVQNFQVHQFRNYLNPEGNLLEGSSVVPPIFADDGSGSDGDGDGDGGGDSGAISLGSGVSIIVS